MFGKLTSQEIESLLARNILGRIGFSDGKQPYILPISYAYHDKSVYCHSYEGTKLTAMRKHPSVCFQVDEITNMGNWKSALCWGTFSEITDKTARAEAIRHLSNRPLPFISSETTHLFPQWPFEPEDLNELKGVIFRIAIDKKVGRFEQYDKQP
ncbi:MAG: pyridoxamine 5'-phosphate oxidase family protein [Chitinophagaceae bacterium]|nr:pyridoxamine 5'-phosphate oxidase family protein [Chitinophagaceae bacterium]